MKSRLDTAEMMECIRNAGEYRGNMVTELGDRQISQSTLPTQTTSDPVQTVFLPLSERFHRLK